MFIIQQQQQQQQQYPFNSPLSRTTRSWVSKYQKDKTNLDLLEQEIVSGSGISRAIPLFRTTWLSRHQKGKLTTMEFNKVQDNGEAVVLPGLYANHLHIDSESITSTHYYRLNAVTDAQPTV